MGYHQFYKGGFKNCVDNLTLDLKKLWNDLCLFCGFFKQ